MPLVALDFETTGLDPTRDAIVSIGLIPFTLQRIYCRQGRYRVVKPAVPLSSTSVTIHGITHSEIEAAPPLDDVLGELLAALAGRVVVVHYRAIERPFLDHALRQSLGEGIEFPVIDTMELERPVVEAQRGFLDRLMRRPNSSRRLPDCRDRYGLPGYPLHHALVDALATAELLQAQVHHHHAPDTPVAELWC